MIRPTLNIDYFHALYDEAKAIGIEVEAHRELHPEHFPTQDLSLDRHRDWSWCIRDGIGVHGCSKDGG